MFLDDNFHLHIYSLYFEPTNIFIYSLVKDQTFVTHCYLPLLPQTVVGVMGIVGNILSILVLSTKDMRNSFNLLLIVLAW